MELKKAIVIGSGIAGLASSIRLALKGYQVDVFEKNNGPGGKLTEFQLGSYRFDFGPSLFTMPQYVIELFELAGKDHKDYFDYIDLKEACNYFYPDSLEFTAPTDPKEFSIRASKTFGVEEELIDEYFKYNKKIFEQSGHIFLNNSMHKLSTFLSKDAIKSVMQSYVIELFRTMNAANVKQLKDEKLVQLFNRYATYNGSNPYKAPAMLNSISVLEHIHGTYFPKGGMYNITQAIFRLAEELGVNFHFNQYVEQINVKNGKTLGVSISGEKYASDIVISNMDVRFTYDRLLPNHELPAFYKNMGKSSSAIIFYWGIKKQFDKIGLHNIFFSSDYKKEFDHIFEKGAIYEDPTIYINNSSLHCPSDVPVGSSNWFVMINSPEDQGEEKAVDIDELRANVLKKLSFHLGEDISELIEEERIVTPKIIESFTLSHKGSLYGSNSNKWTSAFLRHPNFSNKLNGLYFVGGSVHPGGGIPLCLLSAKITISLINE